MKRLFFIIGIVIIIILVGVLLFLLFASETQKQQVFNAFNLNGSTLGDGAIGTIVDAVIPGEDEQTLAPLRQLTLKSVIGAVEVTEEASSTEPFVYYAEAGTGHVFRLDIKTAAETRLSNITIPTAQKASFSKDGYFAAIATDVVGEGRALTLISLPQAGSDLTSAKIPELVREFTITSDNKLLYTTVVEGVLSTHTYNPATNDTKTLFTLPFRDATVRFGTKSTDSIYVYPKTADNLEGYLYEVNGGVIQRLPIAGYGLSATAKDDTIVYSLNVGGTLTSYTYQLSTKSSTLLPLVIFPEKCVLLPGGGSMFCGVATDSKQNSLEGWYKGTVINANDLELYDSNTGSFTVVASPQELVGRDIDLENPSVSTDVTRFYFTNKLDGTLWIFDLSLLTSQ